MFRCCFNFDVLRKVFSHDEHLCGRWTECTIKCSFKSRFVLYIFLHTSHSNERTFVWYVWWRSSCDWPTKLRRNRIFEWNWFLERFQLPFKSACLPGAYLLPHSWHECDLIAQCNAFTWLIRLIFCTNFWSQTTQQNCRSFLWIFVCMVRLLRFFNLKQKMKFVRWSMGPAIEQKYGHTFFRSRHIAISVVRSSFDRRGFDCAPWIHASRGIPADTPGKILLFSGCAAHSVSWIVSREQMFSRKWCTWNGTLWCSCVHCSVAGTSSGFSFVCRTPDRCKRASHCTIP